MIKDINFEYFKTFYVVATEGNLTKASNKLYISQPAITQTIQKLENGLNLKLFIRNKKGVILTEEGKQIYEQLKQAYYNLYSIEKIASDSNELSSGNLKIGCGSNISKKVLLKPLTIFHKDYPNITFSQIDMPQNVMLEMLDNCTLDLCISQYNEELANKYNFLPIFEEKFVFVCTSKYLEFVKKTNPLFIVQGSGTYNKKLFNEYVKKQNIKNFSVFESVGYNFSLELALADFGISLIPYYLIENYLKENKLIIYSNQNFEKTLYGVYTNIQIKSKKIDTFMEYLKNSDNKN